MLGTVRINVHGQARISWGELGMLLTGLMDLGSSDGFG
jgi:hypothetical protein